MGFRSLAQRVRQHHAVEHATLTLLSEKLPGTHAVARSDIRGFIVYGDVDPDQLARSAKEALKRLQGGESGLAIHANCGTNLVTAGMLSGMAALLAAAGTRRSFAERLPSAILGATAALVLAAPAGRWVQTNLTTSAAVEGLHIASVKRLKGSGVARHRVTISD